MENRKLHLRLRVCSFTVPGFQILASRSLFSVFLQVEVRLFYRPKNMNGSLIRVQKSN